MNEHQLTVRELIDLLGRYRPDTKVDIEGCDCTGNAFGVEGWNEKDTEPQPPENATIVLIKREVPEWQR